MAQPPVGTGARFAALKSKLSKEKGVDDPGALAASIGKKKYGSAGMAKLQQHKPTTILEAMGQR